jgi:hypothetical protein
MSKAKLFVKFSKFNVGTIAGLINKTVKFSTVYEFNDPNELIPIYFMDTDMILEKYKEKYESEIQKVKSNVTQEQLELHLKAEVLLGRRRDVALGESEMLRLRYLNSVKIFCVSSASVFDDDSAQIMFSHYADNWQGIACIYEINSENLGSINYQHHIPILVSELGSAAKGDADKEFFRTKACQWRYEKEWRIVVDRDPFGGGNGIEEMSDHKITLKAILYTPKLADTNKKLLEQINHNFYGCEVKLKEVTANESYSGQNDYFLNCGPERGPGIVKVSEWLKKLNENKEKKSCNKNHSLCLDCDMANVFVAMEKELYKMLAASRSEDESYEYNEDLEKICAAVRAYQDKGEEDAQLKEKICGGFKTIVHELESGCIPTDKDVLCCLYYIATARSQIKTSF